MRRLRQLHRTIGEPVAGIVGLGVAMALRHDRFQEVTLRMQLLRDAFERRVLDALADVEINGAVDRRVANTTNLHFRGLDGQAFTARLDQVGIRCSQSSACTNERPEPSYVLQAMGLSETEASADPLSPAEHAVLRLRRVGEGAPGTLEREAGETALSVSAPSGRRAGSVAPTPSTPLGQFEQIGIVAELVEKG